jgi:hypothetical protein
MHRDSEVFRPAAHVIGQRGGQAEALEFGRSQFADAKRDVSIELQRELLQRFYLDARFGSARRTGFEHLQRQPECGELLTELVVQFARDSPSLFLLSENDTRQ